MAQKPHSPTPETRAIVVEMTALGRSQDAIAGHVGVAVATLKRHYAEEMCRADPTPPPD